MKFISDDIVWVPNTLATKKKGRGIKPDEYYSKVKAKVIKDYGNFVLVNVIGSEFNECFYKYEIDKENK